VARRRLADAVSPTLTLRSNAPDESSRDLGVIATWVRVLDAQGRPVIQQGPSPSSLPRAALSDLTEGLRAWTTSMSVFGGAGLRAFVRPVFARQERRVATVQIITTTTQVDDVTHRLLLAMGVAGALIVLVGALGALFLADRALRPVAHIARLATAIGTDDLHRRVGAEVWGVGREPRDELGHLARTFDAMLARLQAAHEQRRRLTADVAHELGTPIAAIVSGAELALRHARDVEANHAALRHIVDEGRYLDRVLDDLLALARGDAGVLVTQQEIVEIDEVCRQAAAALGPLALEQDISVDVDLPPHAVLVRGDELRLAQVVRNLLDNAIRYTPSGGVVALTLRQDEDDGYTGTGPTVTISVSDTGPGIPPTRWTMSSSGSIVRGQTRGWREPAVDIGRRAGWG
jgi:signal transduction histidine kinase